MKLKGIEFGHVFNASGARNFFGDDAYWFHKPLALIGLTYRDCTFISKTTTLHLRSGFMPLKRDSTQPVEIVPGCIKVYPSKGMAMNKVGLAGRGMTWLLEQNRWQKRVEPFVISIMAVEDTGEKRLDEIRQMVTLISAERGEFQAAFALEVNISCPNVGHEQEKLVFEVFEMLNIISEVLADVPIIVKINAVLPVETALKIELHHAVDAFDFNSIPFGKLPEQIPWETLLGSKTSPLAGYGRNKDGSKNMDGGGLSGAPLYPIVKDWIMRARAAGLKKPIIACGGILDPMDVRPLADAGASAIAIGSVSFLRPWRVQSIINEAKKVFG